jgi:hypothetical protein
VIYDKEILPPLLISGSTGAFPIESTLFTIEVKTRLNAGELRIAHASAANVEKFKHAPAVGNEPNLPVHKPEHVISCLFAYGSDLEPDGKSEVTRYDEIREMDDPSIRMICVVGRGVWFWHEQEWISWNFDFKYGEICGFMAGIINSAQRVAKTRKRPDFRAYFGWNRGTGLTINQLVQG